KHIGESNSKLYVLDFKKKNVHIREIKLSKNSPLEDKKPVVQQKPVKTKVQNSERKPIIASGNNEPTKNLESKDKRNHETAGAFQQHSSDFSEEDFEAVIKAKIRKAEEATKEFFALEEINRMKRENEERRNDKKQEDASLKVVFKKEPKMTNRERVIEFLKKHGGKATQQDIGYELKIIPQNISTLLGKMEKSGEIDKRNEKGRNIITLLGIKVVQKEEAKPKKRKAGISDKQKKEEILRILKKGKLFQKELEVESGYPQCIISQLIREMEEDGAVSRERKGKKGFVISLKSEN
ncbi:MAG: hypothetical protein KAS78_02250, partial [Candidatus Pacebacteria bacterium]|nr:hypothetical protein [Candidatus Paceibacterota bacterium]